MARGRTLLDQGRRRDSTECFKKALALEPSNWEALNDLGIALKSSNELAAGMRSYRRASTVNADDPAPVNNLANALAASGDRLGASYVFDRVRRRAPWFAEGHQNRGDNLRHLVEFDDARASLRAALALKPDMMLSHKSLSAIHLALGEIPAAIAALRRVLAIAATAFDNSDLLFTLAYDDATTNDELFVEARRWARRYGAEPAVRREHSLDPERRLRIGYVSADLCNHPVSRSLIGLIASHDRRQVDVVVYAEVVLRDATTDRFRALAGEWHPTVGLSDAEVGEQVRRDRIDILVFVAGHTGFNRLSIAARCAAPLQVSLFAPSTTGLPQVDAWLTDAVLHPEDTTERFVERLERVPCLIPLEPPDTLLPAIPWRDDVVFASSNNPAKHTPAVYRLWARVLAETPRSRLRLKYRGVYRTASLRRRIVELFRHEGVDPDRLDFVTEMQSREDHLADAANMDIALDPFPFNGCNTTFDALWMGVPVVTRAGDRFLSRMSASFLTRVGLSDLVAQDDRTYVEAAKRLAADAQRRAGLRRTLRDRLAASPLCDPVAHARSIEDAYRRLWRDKCLSGSGDDAENLRSRR
jgi:predicted O-linked N-acetylglucosamine transferase (SPINDLY family)